MGAGDEDLDYISEPLRHFLHIFKNLVVLLINTELLDGDDMLEDDDGAGRTHYLLFDQW